MSCEMYSSVNELAQYHTGFSDGSFGLVPNSGVMIVRSVASIGTPSKI